MSVLQDTESVFTIDLFQPANSRLLEFAPYGSGGDEALERLARRRIVDHVRASLLAGLAGVEPGRDGRNSVVRRLLRRAALQGRMLGIDQPFLSELVIPLAEAHGTLLTAEEHTRIPTIARGIADEEVRFERVLTVGLKYLSQLEPDGQGRIQGFSLFLLHAEKGFPPDLAAEILTERGFTIDWSSYEPALEEHKRVSRASVERHFHNA
jgi:alanyl-tRNA synthetase